MQPMTSPPLMHPHRPRKRLDVATAANDFKSVDVCGINRALHSHDPDTVVLRVGNWLKGYVPPGCQLHDGEAFLVYAKKISDGDASSSFRANEVVWQTNARFNNILIFGPDGPSFVYKP